MKDVFSGKWVWITGASSGIGKGLALALASAEASLVLSSRNVEKLEEVKKISGLDEDHCLIFPLDVSDEQAVKNVAEKVLKTIPRLDYLFNNAGISQRGLVRDTGLEVDRKIMDVNYFGAVALTKAVLPGMIRNGGGHIVVTSSIVGKFGFPMRSAYAASKHALHGFFETLMVEEKNSHIAVTLLIPGHIVTDVSINALTATGEKYGKMDPGQAKGISVEKAVSKILKGVARRKREIIIGNADSWSVYLKKYFPGLFFKIAGRVSPV
ncbi:MAG: SDR family oxidoreductase [Bacteroidales bacterium]|nr:SDR family oxidoreductase [Bacteroidales bacterium]